MGSFGADRCDSSNLDAATAASRVAGWIVGVVLGFDLGRGCGHWNLPQWLCQVGLVSGPPLPRASGRPAPAWVSHRPRTGRCVAPSRLGLKDQAIEAARAPTRHEARGASEDASWLHGSASPRHAQHRQLGSGELVPSRLGSGAAGASGAQRPPAGRPADDLRLPEYRGREPA
jgi:hypothetical protein